MENKDEVIEILNDLIMINNDRIAGYEKVYDETKEIETDLRALFRSLADDSKAHIERLTEKVTELGGEPASGTMASGKLYRIWMDIRAVFTFDNRLAVLSNAEGGEDAAQKAYDEALKSDILPEDVRDLISSQKIALLAAHDNIKKQISEQKDVERYPLTS